MSDPIREALVAFADFLHRLPDESGYEVGPMKVKFHNGQVIDGPWWVGQNDSRRWVDLFLSDPALAAPVQASVPEGWIQVWNDDGSCNVPTLPADGSEVPVWTWDGVHVREDEWGTWHEQPAGPLVGGSIECGPDFLNADDVSHWMPRYIPAAPRSTETEIEDVKDQDMAFARRAAIAIYDMNRDLPESDRLAAVYIAGAKHHAEAIGSTETGR